MDIRGSLRRLVHNKWALAGVAGAAGLGLYAYLHGRKSSAASGASDSLGTGTSDGTGVVGAGTLDTTGTDLASWFGNYQQSLQDTLTQSLQPVTDALAGLQGSGTTSGTGNSPATRVITLGPEYKALGSNAFGTVAHTYGLSIAQLEALNPQLAGSYFKVTVGNHLRVPATVSSG